MTLVIIRGDGNGGGVQFVPVRMVAALTHPSDERRSGDGDGLRDGVGDGDGDVMTDTMYRDGDSDGDGDSSCRSNSRIILVRCTFAIH